jgi:hypothetical protein
MQPAAMSARRRRLFLPVGLLALVLLLGLGAFVRGTWADEHAREPARVEDGAICHVHRLPGGAKEVRCALRVPFPMDEVWLAITDYDHYGDICSYIQAGDVRHDPDGRTWIEARARSGLPGTVPFAVELRHEQTIDEWTSSWDQPSGDVVVNRGRWVLRPTGPRETLIVLRLEVQMRFVPTFILRNISLHRLRRVVLAVERRLREGPTGQSW